MGQIVEIDSEEYHRLKNPWQPIETAPKDGTILFALDELHMRPWRYECEWNGVQWYHGFGDGWPAANPTHWMQIPSAPDQSSQ